MKLTPVNPPGFPPNPVLSQGMGVSGMESMLFVSGQVGVGPDGALGKDMEAQTRAAIANLNAVLAAGGMSAANIAKMTIYLTDETQMGGFKAGAGASLPSPPPAITLLFVKGLASPEMLIEIEAIAVK